MKRTKLPLLALLLAPALTFADTVSINWTGQIQIDDYNASGSAFPQSLSDTSVSGVITVNTDLLPPADQPTPPGIVSFGGSGYLQSSVQWAGGLFLPEPAGISGSNTLALDTTSNSVCTINDFSTYTDALGTSYSPLLTFTFNGLDQLGTSLELGSFGSAFSAGGQFSNVITDTSGDVEADFSASFTVDNVSVSRVSVPAPSSTPTALTLLAGVLTMAIRGRRRQIAA
jgi:hypothetical protein